MQDAGRNIKRVATGAAAGVGAGLLAIRRIPPFKAGRVSTNGDTGRWRVVTINLPPDQVTLDRLEPLRQLGDMVEVETRPAPGGRGTEVAARLRGGEPSGPASVSARVSGDDPRQAVRSALRQAKQLLETGEILCASEPPSIRRTPTGRPLDLAEARAGGEGRL